MSTLRGFAELQSPKDLVEKLRHDLVRMEKAPQDQYAAFDFFVTADSIIDWLHPDVPGDKPATELKRQDRSTLRSSSVFLRVAAHIANGAKHFVVTRHSSVAGIKKEHYVEPNYVDDDYVADPLLVHLTPEEAAAAGVDQRIDGVSLARAVLHYWTVHA